MRGLVLLIAGCAACACGCVTRGERAPASAAALRALDPVVGTNGIYLESVLIDRPLGDAFLDRDLWAAAVPVGSAESSALLAENGLRAAVLRGNPPDKFRKLLDSEADTLGAKASTFGQRTDDVVPTSSTIEKCKFELLPDLAAARAPVELERARLGVRVRPERTADARVRVSCEPEAQHGERKLRFRPTADATGFVTAEELPVVRYPKLACDAVLGPGDYLLVGWFAEQPNTLGAALFAAESEAGPRQRVLVVRARVLNPGPPPDLPPVGGSRRPSVAAEAGKQ
jgi:hypothetical protein